MTAPRMREVGRPGRRLERGSHRVQRPRPCRPRQAGGSPGRSCPRSAGGSGRFPARAGGRSNHRRGSLPSSHRTTAAGGLGSGKAGVERRGPAVVFHGGSEVEAGLPARRASPGRPRSVGGRLAAFQVSNSGPRTTANPRHHPLAEGLDHAGLLSTSPTAGSSDTMSLAGRRVHQLRLEVEAVAVAVIAPPEDGARADPLGQCARPPSMPTRTGSPASPAAVRTSYTSCSQPGSGQSAGDVVGRDVADWRRARSRRSGSRIPPRPPVSGLRCESALRREMRPPPRRGPG